MSTAPRHARRSGPRHARRSTLRKTSAGVLAAALALFGSAATAVAVGAPAQAADPIGTSSTGSRWRLDPALTTLREVNGKIGASYIWSKSDLLGQKVTGKGVGVALIDSGITPVKGLAQPGKVINGPDLSFESQAPNLAYLDTFGHGTHMAGIIAGRDPDTNSLSDPKTFVGVAPDAHLVNMKVAAADGAVDVSQVIAAIDWTITHRNDPGLNIRVINLSFGTDSLQSPKLDPLAFAVESAWKAGIVVVASVGNDGPTDTRVSNPAINPYIIAVGGADTAGTTTPGDDTVGDFSTRGDADRHADLLAPGRSIVSLRDPGAFIDVNYPGGLVADDTGRYFKGSGTSQAAAVVSGAVALLLQQRPELTPDQVKNLLTSTAVPLPGADAIAQGAGELNITAAVAAPTPNKSVQNFPKALGTGSLEAARGSAHVADSETGVELIGELDIMGQPWNPATWTTASAAGTAWTGGLWNGNLWAGEDWTGTSWAARTWSARTWSARTWSDSSWTARTWSDATWTGDTWSARTWSARTWSARTWSGSYLSSTTWK